MSVVELDSTLILRPTLYVPLAVWSEKHYLRRDATQVLIDSQELDAFVGPSWLTSEFD